MTKPYSWLDLTVLENIRKKYDIELLDWQIPDNESVDIQEETEKNESALKSP
jgi:hypothetical protein